MSANTKVAATFHGTETTHNPCCSSHGENMTCEKYRRTHFVEVGACCGNWVEPEPTPEQDLRAAIADMLADAVHFNDCAGKHDCTCLLGRILWGITAEQVKPGQTQAAIDTMARHLIGLRLRYDEFGAEMWEDIPEVGANDFQAITKRVESIITAADPTPAEFDDAYAHLRSRVDGAA